jgi:hypothetical protein
LALCHLAISLSGYAGASDPASDPALKAGRTLLDSWVVDGQTYSAYRYGTYEEHTVTVTPPAHVDIEGLPDLNGTMTVKKWSNGTSLEVVDISVADAHPTDIVPTSKSNSTLATRACKRSCVTTASYYWTDTTEGYWWDHWIRTNSIGYHGGNVLFCDGIITSPTFSGSIGVGYGPLSGSLGISPDPTTSTGRCYGCVARQDGDGCSRLWYRYQMHWRQGNFWRHEQRYDNGMNQCSICTGEYDRTDNLGQVHADWPVMENGFPNVSPGCSPCNQ